MLFKQFQHFSTKVVRLNEHTYWAANNANCSNDEMIKRLSDTRAAVAAATHIIQTLVCGFRI